MKRPKFIMSAETRFIRDQLAKIPVGGSISYADLSLSVGFLVSGGTPSLSSARRNLLTSERIVFDVIRGVGLRRLNDHEIVESSGSFVDSIRRKARKAIVTITSVDDWSKMDNRHQLAHTTNLSVLTAISEVTRDRNIAKIEKAVSGRASELPVAETLRAFIT